MSSKPKDAKAAVDERTYMDVSRFTPKKGENKPTSDVFTNHYAYLDLGNGLSKTISGFKRLTAPINPFAIQQGSTGERLGFTPSINSKWWMPSPLTNNISHGRLGPSHFHAETQANLSPPDGSHAVLPLETFGNLQVSYEPIPVACVRPLQKFYRCRMINGEERCQKEADDFLAQCPNPVLSELRNKKLTQARHRQIQLEDYRKAIEVSDYNKGRSVAAVPANAHWTWGTRSYLRPDSLWADERYSNVTPQEIEEAKKRLGEMNKRFNARLDPKIQKVPHVDTDKQFVSREDLPVYAK